MLLYGLIRYPSFNKTPRVFISKYIIDSGKNKYNIYRQIVSKLLNDHNVMKTNIAHNY